MDKDDVLAGIALVFAVMVLGFLAVFLVGLVLAICLFSVFLYSSFLYLIWNWLVAGASISALSFVQCFGIVLCLMVLFSAIKGGD